MSNHRPRGDLRDWLTAKLEDQLDEASPTPATTRQHVAPRGPRASGGAPPAPLLPSRQLHDPSEDDADPETVLHRDFSLDDDLDPRTVRIHRMPVSFIGESVIDPATVRVESEEVSRWRHEAPLDEVPLVPRRTPTPPPREPVRAAEPGPPVELAPEGPRDWVGLFATALLGGGIGLVFVALWAWMIR